MSGIRKEKSARLKYLLGSSVGKFLKTRTFDEIKVTELCKEVSISKVTFFKYFSCKEELLRYYFRVWCLEIGVELSIKPRNGIEGIYYIFDKVYKSIKDRPSFLINLISYQMNDERIRAPYPISQLERKLYFPDCKDLESIEIKSLEQYLDTFALESVLENSISFRETTFVTWQLHTYLLGSIVKTGLSKEHPNAFELRQRIDSILDSFK